MKSILLVGFVTSAAIGCSPNAPKNPSSGGATDMGTPAPSGKSGRVIVGSTASSASYANAAFVLSGTPDLTCTHNKVGSCDVQTCSGFPPQVSAGTIAITGGSMPESLSFAMGSYNSFTVTDGSQIWPPDTSVKIAAAGDVVPAFSGMVTVAGRVTISAPSAPSGSLTVNRANDLAVAWSGGAASDKLTVSAVASQSSNLVILACTFATGAGSGTVPKEALAMMPAGSSTLIMTNSRSVSVTASDYAVELRGDSAAFDATTGAPYGAVLTWQ